MAKKYIGWDTSSPTGVVVAFEITESAGREKFRLVSEWSLSFETSQHSERLLWTIDTVLKSAGWKLSELTALGVGIGPGSFTGLRIGITTAKILAAQLKIPTIAVSSLALLARGIVTTLEADKKNDKTLLIACTDATKGEWFTLMGAVKSVRDCISMSEGDEPGLWSKATLEQALTPEEVIERAKTYLKKNAGTSWVAMGQSVERYPGVWKELPANRRLEVQSLMTNQASPRMLAQLMWESVQQGVTRDPLLLKPRYLRASEAEVKLKNGQLKPAPVIHRGGIA